MGVKVKAVFIIGWAKLGGQRVGANMLLTVIDKIHDIVAVLVGE